MKKILLTTTALVASAGFAMADVSLSGSADMGFKHDDSSGDKTNVESDVDININAAGETDGGISWTANAGLGNDTSSGNSGASTGTSDNGSVSISGDFGTIKVGAVTEADSNVGIADVGYDGIGIDNVAEENRLLGTHDLSWNYAMDGISLDVSMNTHTDASAVSAAWTSGALSIRVAHGDDGTTGGASSNSGSISTSVGAFSISAMAAKHSTASKGTSSGVAASWAQDGFGTMTVVIAESDADTDASYGIGFSKSLGGGATLAGGYGSQDQKNVGDIGISFSF
jgi:outer membrane protein OmpU